MGYVNYLTLVSTNHSNFQQSYGKGFFFFCSFSFFFKFEFKKYIKADESNISFAILQREDYVELN